MRRRMWFGRSRFLLLLPGLLTAGVYSAGAQEIDAPHKPTVRSLKDSPKESAESGSSTVAQPSIRLERMLLLLQPSAAQQKALDTLLEAQQTKGDPRFHQWLTPAEFADRFANSAANTEIVSSWLRAQGFAVAPLPATRGWIEFSGTAAQVEQSFSLQGRLIEVLDKGGVRYRLPGEIKLPTSIATLVKGLVSLDGVLSAVASTESVPLGGSVRVMASQTSLSDARALSPALVEQWLYLTSLKTNGVTGVGESVAIPSRSNVRPEDFAAFRNTFGLPEAVLDVRLNGADPGLTADEASAIQAVSWAGVAAPEARIILIPAASTNATDGLDLALAASVDAASTHTISVGYSACESAMSPTHRAFYAALYRQAAAEGITVIAATGDSGAAACHRPDDGNLVTTGKGVNGLASTPWNTAVGAVVFATDSDSSSDSPSLTGWQPSSLPTDSSASGGGVSLIYATPNWQSATGLQSSDPESVADHHRYLPDISLPTAIDGSASRGMVFCLADGSGSDGCRLVSSKGSAVSAAVFSGIAALLAQKYGPQGNLAPNLYALRQGELGSKELSSNDTAPKDTATATAFTDVIAGSAKLPCVVGSPACEDSGEIGFSSAPGYDLVSGLGSVNAQILIKNWLTPLATGTTLATVEMTNTTGITYNPTANITLAAKVISGSGGTVPTGTVQFVDESSGQNTGSPITLASDGTASYTEDAQFSIGGHSIAAKYSGDSTYAAGESQPITITIQPSATSLIVTPSTITPAAGSSIIIIGTVTATNPGDSPPTGSLTVNLDGLPQGTQRFSTTGTATTASMTVTAPTAGSHTIQGTYSGDISYNNSVSPAVTITVAKSASVTTISAIIPSKLTAGAPETFTASVAPLTVAIGATFNITGTVSFFDGGTKLLGTATISSNTAILPSITLSASAVHIITAVYSGDTSYDASTSAPLVLQPTLLPVTVVLTANNPVLAPGQSANLTATVTPVNTPISTAEQQPTGSVLFYAGTLLLSEAALGVGVGDSGSASISVSTLPAGGYALTAVYAGDLTYGSATSNSLNLQVEDFSISCSTTNIDMVQGTTQSVTCAVASLGGLSGNIQVACAEQNPPQLGAIGCSFDPEVVNGNGPTTLTVVTKAGDISENKQNRMPGPPWSAMGGVALAFAGVLLSPIGRRVSWLRQIRGRKLVVLALLLAGIASAGLGCSNGVKSAGDMGTPLGVHTLKITAGSVVNTVTVTHNTYLTVNITP